MTTLYCINPRMCSSRMCSQAGSDHSRTLQREEASVPCVFNSGSRGASSGTYRVYCTVFLREILFIGSIIRPLFVKGEHAASFPEVSSQEERRPDSRERRKSFLSRYSRIVKHVKVLATLHCFFMLRKQELNWSEKSFCIF